MKNETEINKTEGIVILSPEDYAETFQRDPALGVILADYAEKQNTSPADATRLIQEKRGVSLRFHTNQYGEDDALPLSWTPGIIFFRLAQIWDAD